jgi:hypothetical protein
MKRGTGFRQFVSIIPEVELMLKKSTNPIPTSHTPAANFYSSGVRRPDFKT